MTIKSRAKLGLDLRFQFCSSSLRTAIGLSRSSDAIHQNPLSILASLLLVASLQITMETSFLTVATPPFFYSPSIRYLSIPYLHESSFGHHQSRSEARPKIPKRQMRHQVSSEPQTGDFISKLEIGYPVVCTLPWVRTSCLLSIDLSTVSTVSENVLYATLRWLVSSPPSPPKEGNSCAGMAFVPASPAPTVETRERVVVVMDRSIDRSHHTELGP